MNKESIILLATVISALATIVLAYLTWRYVKLTHEMVNEIKKSRDPLVIIDFIKRKGHYETAIEMVISNKGLSPAKDINLKALYETPFYQTYIIKGKSETKNLKLNDLPIFENGIPYLAPGNDILENIGRFKNEDIQKSPKVKIIYSFKTETGETIYRNIMLDLRYLAKEE